MIFLLLLCLQFEVINAVNVRHYTNLPGKYEKPGTNVSILKPGVYTAYEVFDWRSIDPKLQGEGHQWLRVGTNEWVYYTKNLRIIK